MFADILILRSQSNHDQILTYLLPTELAQVEAGSLVSVPVRQQLEKGLVVRLHEDMPEIKTRLKQVDALLDDIPPLTQAALTLAQWISEYYICSLNKAAHLFLPPPVRQVVKEVLVINKNETGQQFFLAELENKILDYLKNNLHKKISSRDIVNKYGINAKLSLEMLFKQDILRIKKDFSPDIEDKLCVTYKLSDAAPDWLQIAKKAPRQGEVLKGLQDGLFTLKELKERYGQIQPALRSMVKKGWIIATKEQVSRNPFANRLPRGLSFSLNEYQSEASRVICAAVGRKQKKIWLLHGITGSGKTAVYIEAIAEALKTGRQVLYLVPEIALTPQITSLLLDAFGDLLAILHSALTPGERHDEWKRIRQGKARVVLGPRSAVFAPFTDLGLIIVDEEHENTYKQNEPDPRYDTRQVVLELAEQFGACVVMGSATPSLKAYDLAQRGEYELLKMPQRIADRPLPEMTIIDMKKELKDGNKSIFSRYLREALERIVEAGEQAILFMNRRGYHTFVLCRECGKSLTCPHCDITLTYHQSKNRLVCHYCNFQRQLPQKCPSCGSHFIRYYGTGTERVCRELEILLPGVKYLRMDADTTQNKGSHTSILKDFQEQKAKILIGTQMVAKGLDFPAVTLVGIINVDGIINLPDYQAGERAYQLITQVSGRAGRGEQPGQVVIQTFSPEHYLFETVAAQDYEAFFANEMSNRKFMLYPPYCRLVRILVSGVKEKPTLDKINYLAGLLKEKIEKKYKDTELLGPSPAPLTFLHGRFRYHLLLKSESVHPLQELARLVRQEANEESNISNETRIIIDVEPQNLL